MPDHGLSRTLIIAHISKKVKHYFFIFYETFFIILKKNYIFNTIWGSDSESELQTLTVHIKWLREKIESDPKHPKHIITEWGVGYRFE